MEIPILVKMCKPMTVEEECEVLKRFSEGETQLKEKIIMANTALIYKYAIKFGKQDDVVENLFESGLEAFCIALNKFDYQKFKEKDCKRFYSYANRCIVQRMLQVKLNLPNHLYSYTILNAKKIKEEWEEKGLNEEEIYKKIKKQCGIKKDVTVDRILSNIDQPLSLNRVISDTGTESIDMIADEQNAEDLYIKNILYQSIDWSVLSERERFILDGIYFKNNHLRDIAKKLNICRETVRQTEQQAIMKIRKQLGIKNKEFTRRLYTRK